MVVERLRSAARDDSLRRVPWSGGFVLVRYADWVSDTEVEEYVSKLIQSDDGFCDFLAGFLWQGRIDPQAMGRFLSSDPWGWESRCAKIIETSPEWLTERHCAALRVYMTTVEHKKAQSEERTAGVANSPKGGLTS